MFLLIPGLAICPLYYYNLLFFWDLILAYVCCLFYLTGTGSFACLGLGLLFAFGFDLDFLVAYLLNPFVYLLFDTLIYTFLFFLFSSLATDTVLG